MTPRPFEDLPGSGLLWAINKFVLHPRGYALTLTIGDDGRADHWFVQGDGNEPWAFTPEVDAEKSAELDAFLASLVATRPVASDERAAGCTCGSESSEHGALCPITLLARIEALQSAQSPTASAADIASALPLLKVDAPPARVQGSPVPGRPPMNEMILARPRFDAGRTGFAASYSDESNAAVAGQLHGIEGA